MRTYEPYLDGYLTEVAAERDLSPGPLATSELIGLSLADDGLLYRDF